MEGVRGDRGERGESEREVIGKREREDRGEREIEEKEREVYSMITSTIDIRTVYNNPQFTLQ